MVLKQYELREKKRQMELEKGLLEKIVCLETKLNTRIDSTKGFLKYLGDVPISIDEDSVCLISKYVINLENYRREINPNMNPKYYNMIPKQYSEFRKETLKRLYNNTK